MPVLYLETMDNVYSIDCLANGRISAAFSKDVPLPDWEEGDQMILVIGNDKGSCSRYDSPFRLAAKWRSMSDSLVIFETIDPTDSGIDATYEIQFGGVKKHVC